MVKKICENLRENLRDLREIKTGIPRQLPETLGNFRHIDQMAPILP